MPRKDTRYIRRNTSKFEGDSDSLRLLQPALRIVHRSQCARRAARDRHRVTKRNTVATEEWLSVLCARGTDEC